MKSATRTDPQIDVLSLVGEIDRLPTPPVVYSQINRVVNDPNTSAYDIARIMAEDPGMSARILRMANSAYYSLSQPVGSVRQAIVILGMETVRSMVLSAAVVEAFATYDEEPRFQDEFWRHSLATASAARVLCARKSGGRAFENVEDAFTAGLLHDIGKIVLACYLPELRRQLREHPQFGIVEDRFVEAEVLGVTHAEIGGQLAAHWNLPAQFRAALVHHHDLGEEDPAHRRLTEVIHLADFLAHWGTDVVMERDKLLPMIDWDVAAEFGFSEDVLPELVTLVKEEFGRAETFIEMARKR